MTIRSVPRHGCEHVRVCPTCKAVIGRPCLSKTGLLVYAHKARRDPSSVAKPCAHVWERKPKGLRYVTARGHCKRTTAHPSGYCKEHRYPWRWKEPTA